MQRTADGSPSWLRPDFARLLGKIWAVGLALIFLIRYDAWLLPLQFVELLRATLASLQLGPHFPALAKRWMMDFGCALAVLGAAYPVGSMAVARLLPARKDLFCLLIALAAGLWCLAVATLLIGVWSVPQVPYVLLGLAGWVLPTPRKFLGGCYTSTEKLDAWGRVMIAFFIVTALLNLFGASVPPFEYDELEYHIGAPAEYIRAGQIGFLPHNFYSNLPQLTEMLYLLTMVTSSDIAAKLLHWMFGLMAAVGVYSLGTQFWSRKVGVTAAALFYCVPFVFDLSQTARIDLATTFFAVLAGGGLLRWSEDDGESEYLWLAALAAGGAVCTKWPAIPVVVLPGLLFVVLFAGQGVFKKIGRAVGFSALAAFCVTPWLVKNWCFAGNPVYPLFDRMFQSPHWSVAQAQLFAAKHYPQFGLGSLADFFGSAWHFSMAEQGAVPVLLMTAPLILLLRKAEDAARRAGWLFLMAYGGWFFLTFRPWRFLFPAFPLVALVGAYALDRFGGQASDRRLPQVAVLVVLVCGVSVIGSNVLVDSEDYKRVPPQMSFVHYALGQIAPDDFVQRMGGGVYEPIVWMNKNLPAESKVLYIGEARAYYSRPNVVWATAFDQHPLSGMMTGVTNASELLQVLRDRGVTHIYVDRRELSRLGQGYGYLKDLRWDIIQGLLSQHARLIHEHGPGFVYALGESS